MSSYTHTHLNVEADYCEEGWFQNDIFFLAHLKGHFNFKVSWRWISWHLHIPINVSIITHQNPTTSGSLGLNAFSHPWTYYVSYVFPPCALVCTFSVKVSAKTCHSSVQTSYLSGTTLASSCSQDVRRHLSSVSCLK